MTPCSLFIWTKKEEGLICRVHRSHDGYPSGMGNDIKRIFNDGKSKILTSGDYPIGITMPENFVGMECAAPYLVGKLKTQAGNCYLCPVSKDGLTIDDSYGEWYTYHLWERNGELIMECWAGDKILYGGELRLFDAEVSEREEENSDL